MIQIQANAPEFPKLDSFEASCQQTTVNDNVGIGPTWNSGPMPVDIEIGNPPLSLRDIQPRF